jgi:hypothetical protein
VAMSSASFCSTARIESCEIVVIEPMPDAYAVGISAQVDFVIVRLTQRKITQNLPYPSLTPPETLPDALHRIALESPGESRMT